MQVSLSNAFGTTVVNQGTTGTSLTTSPLVNATQYYWRVNATNAAGTSAWSSIWSFTTPAAAPLPPSPPVLSSPADASTTGSLTPTLAWSAAAGASSYTVQVSLSNAFGTTVVNQGTTGTSLTTSPLVNATQYYWRVNATNAAGTSAWSSIWSFTTPAAAPLPPRLPPPSGVTLLTPANGSTVTILTPTFTWAAHPSSTRYVFQLSTTPSFTSYVVSTGTAGLSWTLSSPLTAASTYYWRVKVFLSMAASSSPVCGLSERHEPL